MQDRVSAETTLLEGLNPTQREAVTHGTGPLLVVAGAGTGKTRVIVRRVAWVVARGTPPPAVLAITFTNKAADVLKDRLRALSGTGGVVAGTFHSFGASVLRRHGDRLGIDRSFSILDAEDQERLLRDLMAGRALPRTFSPEAVADAISHRKNGGAGRAPRLLHDPEAAGELAALETAYEERLRAAALCDFDDLLVLPRRLLLEVEDVAEALRGRFRHVLVDEYQDTNLAQAELLKALLGPERNLFATGDPDQSIYRWRGATIRNILEFHADFPGARRVTLEENYRSTRRILAAAEAVIAANRQRYDKRLRTDNAVGERLVEVSAASAGDEAAAIASTVAGWVAEGVDPSEVAVFFRANHLSRAIELALRTAGVPYRMVSGVEFFRRQEVKDVLAYARLVENPKDDAAFARIVNVPRRGVGDGSVERLRERAVALRTSLAEAAAGEVPGLPRKAREGLAALLATLERLRALPRSPVAPLLDAVVRETGYREDLLARDDDVERSRAENVAELLAAADEADRTLPGQDLRDFLERTSLVSDQDEWEEGSGRVSLMTAHAAKGLEFDRVVIAAAEEGSFPHERNAHTPEEVEEERRLFYVAMTRARERLVVTHAAWRRGWQTAGRRRPSRFLDDVPEDLVEVVDRTGYLDARSRRDLAWSRGRTSWGVPPESEETEQVYRREDADVLRPGDLVSHTHFGAGRVAALSGSGRDLRVTVDFEEAGTKTILWEYACLTRRTGDGRAR